MTKSTRYFVALSVGISTDFGWTLLTDSEESFRSIHTSLNFGHIQEITSCLVILTFITDTKNCYFRLMTISMQIKVCLNAATLPDPY